MIVYLFVSYILFVVLFVSNMCYVCCIHLFESPHLLLLKFHEFVEVPLPVINWETFCVSSVMKWDAFWLSPDINWDAFCMSVVMKKGAFCMSSFMK